MKENFIVMMVIGSIFFVSGCFSQSTNTLQDRLNRQEEEIRQLKSQLSGVQPAQADTWAQVQNLRQELASMTGQIDDFNHATESVGGLAGLARRVTKNEAALQKIEKQFDIKLDEPVNTISGQNPSGFITSPGYKPLGERSTSQENKGSPSTVVESPQATPPSKLDTATVLYDAGVRFFNERNYKASLKSFMDFTETYNRHKLIANAWFWRGEANYQLGNFPAAALDYEQVISNYPTSGKIASSYFKQGLCFYKTGKKDAAKFRLEEVIKKFPNSPEAKRAKQIIKTDF